MRESVGATWIFSICLTFIIIFTAYLAISVNYAKAFRIKNHIVSMIEENEGFNASTSMNKRIEDYLVSEGYTANGTCPQTIKDDYNQSTDWNLTECINYSDVTSNRCNACVYKMTVRTNNDDLCATKSYYRVVTFFRFDLPVVGYMTNFKVSGESKLLYDYGGGSC